MVLFSQETKSLRSKRCKGPPFQHKDNTQQINIVQLCKHNHNHVGQNENILLSSCGANCGIRQNSFGCIFPQSCITFIHVCWHKNENWPVLPFLHQSYHTCAGFLKPLKFPLKNKWLTLRWICLLFYLFFWCVTFNVVWQTRCLSLAGYSNRPSPSYTIYMLSWLHFTIGCTQNVCSYWGAGKEWIRNTFIVIYEK